MTTPSERARSLVWAGAFLVELNKDQTLPLGIRRNAAVIARHFPTTLDIKRMASAPFPDVEMGSSAELADWLNGIARPVAVIDCTSASAPFLKKLSGPPNRVVVVATRSGSENNYARFGDYLSAAIADPAADLDRDGQTSLLEAFVAASRHADEFYKGANRLATEHALIDDNGDGLGTPATWFEGTRVTKASKDGKPADGARAHRWHLVLSDEEQAMTAEARAKRDALEAEVESLRAKKSQLPEAEYYAQLEKLLLRLALVYEPKG